MDILKMNKNEILSIFPGEISKVLKTKEIIHIAKVLGAFWSYDYDAAEHGFCEKHFLFGSNIHTDGFFMLQELLKYPNIRMIMAEQLLFNFDSLGIDDPDWVAGISDDSIELAKDLALLFRSKFARMEKIKGRISLQTVIPPGERILLVEALCTRGINFFEAVHSIFSVNKAVHILPYELVLINRGDLRDINILNMGLFQVVAVAEYKINSWKEKDCPLCKHGSIPVLLEGKNRTSQSSKF